MKRDCLVGHGEGEQDGREAAVGQEDIERHLSVERGDSVDLEEGEKEGTVSQSKGIESMGGKGELTLSLMFSFSFHHCI